MDEKTTDQSVLQRINELVGQEHQMLAREANSDEDQRRLRALQVELDQCWDLLRQRRALRTVGQDADKAQVRPPEIVRTPGVDDENARYEDRVKDLAVAAYVGCAPLAGLPAELYQTPQGGWSNINMTYRLP